MPGGAATWDGMCLHAKYSVLAAPFFVLSNKLQTFLSLRKRLVKSMGATDYTWYRPRELAPPGTNHKRKVSLRCISIVKGALRNEFYTDFSPPHPRAQSLSLRA